MPAVLEWTGLPDSRSAPVGLRVIDKNNLERCNSEQGEGSKTSRAWYADSIRPT